MKIEQSISIEHFDGMSDESLASALEAKARELREKEPTPEEGWALVGKGKEGGLTPDGLGSKDLAVWSEKLEEWFRSWAGVDPDSYYAVRLGTELSKYLGKDNEPPVEPKAGEVWGVQGRPIYLISPNGYAVYIEHGFAVASIKMVSTEYLTGKYTRLGTMSDFLKSEPYDDTVRTYNGEKASEFGLESNDWVLWYAPAIKIWADIRFNKLDQGDQWRKQLPAPAKEDE